MKTIIIDEKNIGEGYPVFLIAEAGVNHNGNLSVAKKLIDLASEAKVDAIKFQTFNANNLILKNTLKVNYQKKSNKDNESFYEMLKKLEFSKGKFRDLKDYCKSKGIIFLSTPFDKEAVKILEEIDIPAYKIGSGDMNNFPLLEYICSKKKPILLSTGMATLEEVKESVDFIKKENIKDLIIFQCTSSYPAKYEDINLNIIDTYLNEFPDVIIGFSDHSLGIEASIGAVAKGAKVIEKHFTLDKNMEGPDHKASLSPNEIINWVKETRNLEKALGSYEKVPSKNEISIAKVARKSVVSVKNMKKGTYIKKEDITTKRPGTGIPASEFYEIIGKKIKRDINKDTLIKWEDLN